MVFSIGLIAALGDFVIPAILSKRYPNYSILKNTISTLGTKKSAVKKQTSVWLITLGLLFVCFAMGQTLRFSDYTWKHLLYTWGIMAFGIGAGVIAGIFQEDSKGVEETISGKVHGIGAGLGFVFLLINPLLAVGINEFDGLECFNIGCFATGAITFILFLRSKECEKGVLALSGLWQRFTLLALYSPLLVNYFAIRPAQEAG
jgi:hypothetical membrane protein